MTTLDAYDVANHWPWIDRALGLPAGSRSRDVLGLLAEAQVRANGAHVQMSSVLRLEGFTGGQLGAARDLLRELAAAGVLWRYSGSGRRGAAWSFTTGVGHRWHGLRWLRSARIVEEELSACRCRGNSPLGAEIAGNRPPLSRNSRSITLPAWAHVCLALRDKGATSAATGPAQERIGTPIRDNGATFVPATPLPSSSFGTTSSSSEEEEARKVIEFAIAEVARDPLRPGRAPQRRLAELVPLLDPEVVVAELRRLRDPDVWACMARIEHLAAGAPAAAMAPQPTSAYRDEEARLRSRIAALRAAGEDEEASELEEQLHAKLAPCATAGRESSGGSAASPTAALAGSGGPAWTEPTATPISIGSGATGSRS